MANRLEDKTDNMNGVRELVTEYSGWSAFQIGDVINGGDLIVTGKFLANSDTVPTDEQVVKVAEKAIQTMVKNFKFVDPHFDPQVKFPQTSTEMRFGCTQTSPAPVPKDKPLRKPSAKIAYPKAEEGGIIVHISKIKQFRSIQQGGDQTTHVDADLVKAESGIALKNQ